MKVGSSPIFIQAMLIFLGFISVLIFPSAPLLFQVFVVLAVAALAVASADRLGPRRQGRRQGNGFRRVNNNNPFIVNSPSTSFAQPASSFAPIGFSGSSNIQAFGGQASRQGRQNIGEGIKGGVDFSGCQTDPETGFCCVEKEETVTTLSKDPILECTHKNVEKCHYTYVTQFEAAQEEVCEENFEKTCQITFKQQAFNETVKKCYKPITKVCNGQGPEECRTVYESSCSTRYIEKQPGKFVGDTKCEKLPVEICGAGCVSEPGPEECHDKVVTSLLDVPEEVCDLNPQKTCRFQTKLVPKLKPEHECTIIPQETCNLKFSNPEQVDKPLKTKWCLDPSDPAPGETYEEGQARSPLITSSSDYQPTYVAQPPTNSYNGGFDQPIVDSYNGGFKA